MFNNWFRKSKRGNRKMFNVKATIVRFCEMSWPSRTKLKAWMKQSKSFNGFDVEAFNTSSLRVAEATNEQGETVCYCPIETCFMIRSFAMNPDATPSEARAAGDFIDAALEREAQRAGVSKLLIVVPLDHPSLQDHELHDFKEVRIFERKFLLNSGGMGLHEPTSIPATNFIN